MDADRRKIVWEYVYRKLYSTDQWEFWNLIDMDHIKNGLAKFKENINIKEYKEAKVIAFYNNYKDIFKISGDADFGLKQTAFEPLMHSICNFSLMPVTGGMNSKKGLKSGYSDEFDTFLIALEGYWNCEKKDKRSYVKENLWNNPHGREITLDILKDYLDLFDSIYDYCKKVYFLEKENVDVLLDNRMNYLDKAIYYFNHKNSILEKCMDKECFEALITENINEEKYEDNSFDRYKRLFIKESL